LTSFLSLFGSALCRRLDFSLNSALHRRSTCLSLRSRRRARPSPFLASLSAAVRLSSSLDDASLTSRARPDSEIHPAGSTWRSSPRPLSEDGTAPAVVEAVASAAAAGFRHFDCAEVRPSSPPRLSSSSDASLERSQAYQTERSVGAALAGAGLPRGELFVTSKVFRALPHVEDEVERQLRELRLESFDLFLIHTPKAVGAAGLTQAEAWARLEGLVDKGLIQCVAFFSLSRACFRVSLTLCHSQGHRRQQLHARRPRRPPPLGAHPPHRQPDLALPVHLPPQPRDDRVLRGARHPHRGVRARVVDHPAVGAGRAARPGPRAHRRRARGLERQEVDAGAGPARLGERKGLGRRHDELEEGEAGGAFLLFSVSLPRSCSGADVSRSQEYVAAGDISLSKEQVDAIDQAGKEGAERGFGTYSSWS